VILMGHCGHQQHHAAGAVVHREHNHPHFSLVAGAIPARNSSQYRTRSDSLGRKSGSTSHDTAKILTDIPQRRPAKPAALGSASGPTLDQFGADYEIVLIDDPLDRRQRQEIAKGWGRG